MSKLRFIPRDFNAASFEIERTYSEWFSLFDEVSRTFQRLCVDRITEITDCRQWGVFLEGLQHRTMGNAIGAMTMLHYGMIVEARALTRCVLENFFYAIALLKEKQPLADKMLDESLSAEKTFLNDFVNLPSLGSLVDPAELVRMKERVKAIVDAMTPGFDARKNSTAVSDIADNLDMRLLYTRYRKMSADASHTKVLSLTIYQHPGPREGTITHRYSPYKQGNIVGETLDTLLLCVIEQLRALNFFSGLQRTAFRQEINYLATKFDSLRATLSA